MFFEFNNVHDLQQFPHFLDEDGRQVSSIGKKSNFEDSFDIKELKEILRENFEMGLYPMRKKQIKELDPFLQNKRNKNKNLYSRISNKSYKRKRKQKKGFN